jgi:hypothetical protein
MLTYFPKVYPGELLYSVLSRLGCHSGILSPTQLLNDAFENRHVRSGAFLQTNLGRLAANIPQPLGLTARKLALENTLLPYLTSYQPEEIRNWAFEALTADDGDAGAIHVRLGLVASNVRLPSVLRYCPNCRTEMLRNKGELYWLRDHQLPGVLVCRNHGVPLADSRVNLARAGQHEFVGADEENCPVDPLFPPWANRTKGVGLLQKVAEASTTLLSTPPCPRTLQTWGDEIKVALQSRGFSLGNDRIDERALREAYLEHFAPILNILPAAVPGYWLEAIVRKHRKAFAPLHHILIRLLIESLPLTSYTNPFGAGPWPCRNPLAEHHGERVIANCKIHQDGGKTIGVFHCCCGYEFSTAPESSSRAKILNLGPKFEARLRELVSSRSTLRGAARELHVDPNTVLRYVALFGLEAPWKRRSARNRMLLIAREEMRAAWTSGCAAAPGLTRQQLRGRIPAVYAWLYRNDRDWLNAQPPAAAGHIPNKPRLDWPSIDAATAQALEQEAARLRVLDPPQQITRLALECALGQRGWLEKRLQKLPLCVAVLSEVTESVEDFQCRRVIWAAEEWLKQGIPISVWRIRRLAALRDRCTAKVESLLIAVANDFQLTDCVKSGEGGAALKKSPGRETTICGKAKVSARHIG